MARTISKGLATILERLELNRPQVVTLRDIEKICAEENIATTPASVTAPPMSATKIDSIDQPPHREERLRLPATSSRAVTNQYCKGAGAQSVGLSLTEYCFE